MNDEITTINPHPSASKTLMKHSSFRKVRKYLKGYGLTKSEQTQLLKITGVYEEFCKKDYTGVGSLTALEMPGGCKRPIVRCYYGPQVS